MYTVAIAGAFVVRPLSLLLAVYAVHRLLGAVTLYSHADDWRDAQVSARCLYATYKARSERGRFTLEKDGLEFFQKDEVDIKNWSDEDEVWEGDFGDDARAGQETVGSDGAPDV